MSRILDQYGRAIDSGTLREPQTAAIRSLQNMYLQPMLDGLSPARLAATLRAADNGDLTRQHRLFSDMRERDPHLSAEMGKRELALLNLDWDIVPPRDANAAEKASAEWCKEVLQEGVDDFEDLLLACMDGVGHGFAPIELEWRKEGAEWLPAFHPRPQEWFRLARDGRSLRLIDQSADGAELLPFGWVFHQHGKAKTGYLGRMGLYRVLSWPFLYKSYGIGDFAEFLETYGLPIIVGKYHAGASLDERESLMRAVTALGHDARAIMPADMVLEVQKITGGGGSGSGSHLDMVDWADKSQSKCILGGTLTSQADGKTSTNALGQVHDSVRHDILGADARQVAGTITRDLIYPLIALNRGGIDSLRRCPRLVFEVSEPEDLVAYADALPKLAGVFRIPAPWAREKLHIPEPQEGEEVLAVAQPAMTLPAAERPAQKGLAALAATRAPEKDLDQVALNAALANLPGADINAAMQALLAPAIAALQGGETPDEAGDALLAAFPQLDSSALETLLARAIFIADVWGRLSAEHA
jgi:phage gp29-like protein